MHDYDFSKFHKARMSKPPFTGEFAPWKNWITRSVCLYASRHGLPGGQLDLHYWRAQCSDTRNALSEMEKHNLIIVSEDRQPARGAPALWHLLEASRLMWASQG